MSSILTNNGAMVALQTLKGINANLAKTQSEISTGKSVATAKDNAAIWAISKTMESDVEGFKGISDALGLGQSTVAVARQASETVTDLLKQMKGKIVAAQGENVDRAKLQTDITALRDQITSVVGAAQFNGLNLLSNTSRTAGTGTVNVLSSLDRSANGVAASNIRVAKEDLGTATSGIAATGGAFNAAAATGTLDATRTRTLDVAAASAAGAGATGFQAGTGFALQIFGTDANNSAFTQTTLRNTAAGAATQTEAAAANMIRYVTRDGDTAADVAKGLQQAFTRWAASNEVAANTLSISASGGNLVATSGLTDATDTIQVNILTVSNAAANTIGGGLDGISSFDVTSAAGARTALAGIEGMISNAIDASASFGSAAGRIETQANFVSGLMDSLKSGIGTLVDANMEEASARLQALQVQQQLGVQSLSIANQAPQSILSLFR